jgi:tetratricopeptide (TPR) repeat protein
VRQLCPATLEQLDKRSQPHLLGLLEQAVEMRPDDVDLISMVGHLLTAVGRYEDGLALDIRLTDLCPEDPIAHYNLACSLSLLGRIDESLTALEMAFRNGYEDRGFLADDPDLDPLRADPRYAKLLARWK